MEPNEEFNPAFKPHLLGLIDLCHELQASGICLCFVNFVGHVNTVEVRLMEKWVDGEDNIPLINEFFRLINYSHLGEEGSLEYQEHEEWRLRKFIQHLRDCLKSQKMIEWRAS